MMIERTHTALFCQIIRRAMPVLGASAILCLIGVLLGAINYVGGPVRYPTWLVAVWFTVLVLVMAIALVHLVLYMLIGFEASTDDPSAAVVAMVGGIALFIGGGIALLLKHLAPLSLALFFALIALIVGDVIYLVRNGRKEDL